VGALRLLAGWPRDETEEEEDLREEMLQSSLVNDDIHFGANDGEGKMLERLQ
jgi:hypothetical protein